MYGESQGFGSEPVLLNVYGAPELMPRNEFRQPMLSGGPVRKPYSSSVPSPHRLFKNSSSGCGFTQVSGSGYVFKIRIQIQKGKKNTKVEKNYEISCFEVLDVLSES
jgi:hypothetical protein